MSGARSSYVMTLSDEELAAEIAGSRAAADQLEKYIGGNFDGRVRGGEDGKLLAYHRERLRQLEEETARRKRHRPPSRASAASSSSAAPAGSAPPKPIGLDDDAAGPPIIIKDSSGQVRTWRPGDGRITGKKRR